MQQFSYKAVDKNGKRIEGVVEANDQANAVSVLRDKGLLITGISGIESSLKYQFTLRFSKVSEKDIVGFTRQFATMMGSGLSMVNALNILQRQSSPAFSRILSDIVVAIEGGDTLYSALNQHPDVFSPLYRALVKAGEAAGVLNEVMSDLAINLERQREFRAKVKGALLYPTIMVVAMVIVGIIMVFFVMPKVSELYEQFEADLPATTKFILGSAEFLRRFWYIGIVAIVGIVLGILQFMSTEKGKNTIDEKVLKIPYWGELQHKIISTNIARTLSLLVKSGVSIVESLEIASQVATNKIYRVGIQMAAKNVEKGGGLAASLAQEKFFPDMVIQMIAVGEETGKLDEMLGRVAKQFQKDALIALKALTTAIEPAMIIILGVGVGVLVMSIIMPIYNLTSQF